MLSLTHLSTGAALASRARYSLWTLPANLALHFLLDAIPHWDLGTNFRKRGRLKTAFLEIFDLAAGFLLIFFFYQSGRPFSPLLWLNALVSILPDLLEAPANFLGFPLFRTLDRIHSGFFHHHAKSQILSLLLQTLLIAGSLAIAII